MEEKESLIHEDSLEIDKMNYILKKYRIGTEDEFSKKYTAAQEFTATMAQSTAHRKFKKYGIVKNPVDGRYIYVGRILREPASELDKLCNLLCCYCEKVIDANEEQAELYIRVDAGCESLLSKAISEYIRGDIFVFPGYSCLYIKFVSKDNKKFQELVNLLEKNNKNVK